MASKRPPVGAKPSHSPRRFSKRRRSLEVSSPRSPWPIASEETDGNRPVMREIAAEPILYTQTGCAETVKVRTWLTDHRISFTERNASVDPGRCKRWLPLARSPQPCWSLGTRRCWGSAR
jgi:hypothetical protein